MGGNSPLSGGEQDYATFSLTIRGLNSAPLGKKGRGLGMDSMVCRSPGLHQEKHLPFWSSVSFKTTVSLLIFCLDDLPIAFGRGGTASQGTKETVGTIGHIN